MKKNLYYEGVFARRNLLKDILFKLFIGLASWPRLLLEVFIRKNFGERYFSFATALFLIVVLAIAPFAMESMNSYGGIDTWEFIKGNFTWYAYLAAFLYFCLQRKKEINNLPSVFDFARFSLSTGERNPRFHEIKIKGEPIDTRLIATVIEPGIFLVAGIILFLLDQKVGLLLILCSVLYSLSYVATYSQADHFIMDKIDEGIFTEELASSWFGEEQSTNKRGVDFAGRRPSNETNRRKLYDSIVVSDDGFEDVD